MKRFCDADLKPRRPPNPLHVRKGPGAYVLFDPLGANTHHWTPKDARELAWWLLKIAAEQESRT